MVDYVLKKGVCPDIHTFIRAVHLFLESYPDESDSKTLEQQPSYYIIKALLEASKDTSPFIRQLIALSLEMPESKKKKCLNLLPLFFDKKECF